MGTVPMSDGYNLIPMLREVLQYEHETKLILRASQSRYATLQHKKQPKLYPGQPHALLIMTSDILGKREEYIIVTDGMVDSPKNIDVESILIGDMDKLVCEENLIYANDIVLFPLFMIGRIHCSICIKDAFPTSDYHGFQTILPLSSMIRRLNHYIVANILSFIQVRKPFILNSVPGPHKYETYKVLNPGTSIQLSKAMIIRFNRKRLIVRECKGSASKSEYIQLSASQNIFFGPTPSAHSLQILSNSPYVCLDDMQGTHYYYFWQFGQARQPEINIKQSKANLEFSIDTQSWTLTSQNNISIALTDLYGRTVIGLDNSLRHNSQFIIEEFRFRVEFKNFPNYWVS